MLILQYAGSLSQKWNKKFRELQSVVKSHIDLLNNSQLRPPQSLAAPSQSVSSSSNSGSNSNGNTVKVDNDHSSNTVVGDSVTSNKRKAASDPVESVEAQEKMKKMKKEDELADIGLLNAGAMGTQISFAWRNVRRSFCLVTLIW